MRSDPVLQVKKTEAWTEIRSLEKGGVELAQGPARQHGLPVVHPGGLLPWWT